MPQETNMAEVIRLLHTVIGKVDGLATDMKEVKSDVKKLDMRMDRLEGRMDRLEGRMDRLDGRMDRLETKMDTVAEKTMENTNGIIAVKGRVDVLERQEH